MSASKKNIPRGTDLADTCPLALADTTYISPIGFLGRRHEQDFIGFGDSSGFRPEHSGMGKSNHQQQWRSKRCH
jgi:hypothetical protein